MHSINETYYRKGIVSEFLKDKYDLLFPGIISYYAKFLRDGFSVILVKEYYDEGYTESIEKYLVGRGVCLLEKYKGFTDFFESHICYLQAYISEINNEFNNLSIQDIEILGDVHPGGVIKCMIQSEEGRFIVYKNNFDSQKVISDYIIHSDYRISECFMSREKRGEFYYRNAFDVFVNSDNRDEILEFYYLFGRCLPRLLLFRIGDLNHENILCSLPYPKFFDIEVCFSDNFSPYNITSIGVLAQENLSGSATLNPNEKRMSYTAPVIQCVDDAYVINRLLESQGKHESIPNNSIGIGEEFIKQHLLKGYEDATEFINCVKVDIIRFVSESDLFSRIVIRPTREYIMIMRMFQYSLLDNSHNSFENRAEKMLGDELIFINLNDHDALFLNEVGFMKSGIVPSYYSNSKEKSVFSHDSIVVGTLNISQFDIWRDHVNALESFLGEQKMLLKTYL